jgi:arsenite methyltransferase
MWPPNIGGGVMAVEVEIDLEVLKSDIKKTYASSRRNPRRTSSSRPAQLGGRPRLSARLARVPQRAVESFAGVASPFSLGRLNDGERVLDLGSGAGTDSLVAAQMVGEQGHVIGST